LIFGGINAIRNVYDFNKGVLMVLNDFKENIPNFVLANGELNVAGQMPIIINDGGPSVIIIDTSGKTAETVLDNYDSATLITEKKIQCKRQKQTLLVLKH